MGDFTERMSRRESSQRLIPGPSPAMQKLMDSDGFLASSAVKETAIVGMMANPPESDGSWEGTWESLDDKSAVILVAAGPGHQHAVSLVFSSQAEVDEFCAGIQATADAIFSNGGVARVPPRKSGPNNRQMN